MCALGFHDQRDIAGLGSPMKKIRVLIVDEHLAVRRALAARLKSFSHIEVVAAACDVHEALNCARTMQPDVVLLELKGFSKQWPDPVGGIQEALTGHPAGIIVLTSYADDIERETALRGGARRYLLKQIDTNHLLAEIEAVANEIAA